MKHSRVGMPDDPRTMGIMQDSLTRQGGRKRVSTNPCKELLRHQDTNIVYTIVVRVQAVEASGR